MLANHKPNELFKGQDVVVEELKIISSTGIDFDLRGMYESLNVFEDLFSPFLVGELLIRDGMNLIQHFPIIGQEKIQITFFTPGLGKNKVAFEVSGISERVYDPTGKQQIYTLYLSSPERMNNMTTRVSKAYEGTISDMVGKIYEEYLLDDDYPVEFLAETTLHTHKFVIPNKKPIDAINWLSKRATSEKNPEQANFLFYQTLDGFKFLSPSTLMNQREVQEYRYDPLRSAYNSAGQRDVVRELQNIKSHSIEDSNNRVEQMKRGMFASKLITHDLVTQQWNEHKYTYADKFDSIPHIEQHPLTSRMQTTMNTKEDSVFRFYPKHKGSQDEIDNNDRAEEWVLQRKSLIQQLSGMTLSLELPGDSSRRVGDIVGVKLPTPEPKHNEIKWEDQYLSGKYMISAIKHTITKDDYTMKAELIRDSVSKPYPDVKSQML